MPKERFFNTAGPVRSFQHYCLPPLTRFDDLDEVFMLIDQQKYFVLHAPRQTGKTSALLALMAHLNQQADYCCLYANVEVGQTARSDVGAGLQAILGTISLRGQSAFPELWPTVQVEQIIAERNPHQMLDQALKVICQALPKPFVLLLDEIDSLVGDTLLSVLRQLRAGYDRRPNSFPSTIILCGVRDVRDYRIYSANEEQLVQGGSAFNIRAKSLRLGNFNQAEMEALYQQHTDETGQIFEPMALQIAWDLTQGQPWLVNALAYETTFDIKAGRDRTRPITAEMIQQAKENLILRRETHLDQLVHKLSEPRVQRVIGPILTSQDEITSLHPDDILYVQDLGLIEAQGELRIANKIYQEIIPRELTYGTQRMITHQTAWYVEPDNGRLDMDKLLSAFQQFFRQHSEHWVERFEYKEAGPQLLLQAFLQRIINGGGRLEREYGLGRQRTDLLIVWFDRQGKTQRVVLELKIRYQDTDQTIKNGIPQTWAYMDKCATTDGHLLIFDRRKRTSWDDKIFRREKQYQGQTIVVWGM